MWMTVVLAVLFPLPLMVWHAHLAWRAIRRGVLDSLIEPVSRAFQPRAFWFGVGRRVFLSLFFAGMLVSMVLGLPLGTQGSVWLLWLLWLLLGCLIVSIAITLAAAWWTRRLTGVHPAPTSSAGPSAPTS